MAGAALFFSALLCKLSVPDLFLAILINREIAQGIQFNKPQSLHAAAENNAGACEARYVVGGEGNRASGITRADVRDAVDDDFA